MLCGWKHAEWKKPDIKGMTPLIWNSRIGKSLGTEHQVPVQEWGKRDGRPAANRYAVSSQGNETF
jgi:hypothetical protein